MVGMPELLARFFTRFLARFLTRVLGQGFGGEETQFYRSTGTEKFSFTVLRDGEIQFYSSTATENNERKTMQYKFNINKHLPYSHDILET